MNFNSKDYFKKILQAKSSALDDEDDDFETVQAEKPELYDNCDTEMDISSEMDKIRNKHQASLSENKDLMGMLDNALPLDDDDEFAIKKSSKPSIEESEESDNTDISEFKNEIMGSVSQRTQSTAIPIVNEAEVADYMLRTFNFVYSNRKLWTFKDIAYNIFDDNELIAMMKDIVSAELRAKSMSFWKGVIGHIKTTSSIHKDIDSFEHPIEEVAFENGIYNVKTGEFRDAEPDDYITLYNHITFDKSNASKKETTKQFFDFISGGNEELKALLWEVLGAILSPTSLYKKFFLLFGPTDTGKSLYGSLAEHLVGLNNCSHIALERLGDKYSVYRLYGKMLNTSLDNSAVELKNLGVLKRLTSGGRDYIEAEGKYAGFCKIRPDRIKLLFASNSLPHISIKEDSGSIRNRMLIIPFLNQVPKNQQNPDLLEKLLEEKDYIIKKAMKAYRRLIENSFEFSKCELSEELLNMTFKNITSVNSVEKFIKSDYISVDPYGYVRGNDLYKAYISFCNENGFIPAKEKTFVNKVANFAFVEQDRVNTDDGYIRVLRGIILN